MNLNFIVFCLIAGLWSLAFAACAIVSGVGLLAFVAGSALVLWCYWRLVVSRPRVQVARAFVGVYDGLAYYTEVV